MRQIILLLLTFSVLINAQDNSSDSKLIITPYGFFKLDMSYDSDLMSAGNFAQWATQNSGDAIATTNITAKQSRFGMNINKGNISGKVEIDFYGVGSAENKGGVLLRKAYAEAKLEHFTIRAGQDSDVISPLVPSTINYPVAWWAGNIGYRRPILKLLGNLNSINWTIALARNIGGDLNGDGIDDGSTAIIPELQGRVALKILDNHLIGFSGHYAQLDTLGTDGKYTSWSTNLDVNVKVTSIISLSGEAFIGNNIAAMLGGIGNASTFNGVDTQGGWVNLKIKPKSNFLLSTGISMDDPSDCDLSDGARSKNSMIFVNIYKDILEGFLVGFEASYWSTEYKNMNTATAMRGQLAFLYNF
ncbi:DcaP family trimeric outer membrane transporter [Candidatus Neomarinimicrobiota bacterium]